MLSLLRDGCSSVRPEANGLVQERLHKASKGLQDGSGCLQVRGNQPRHEVAQSTLGLGVTIQGLDDQILCGQTLAGAKDARKAWLGASGDRFAWLIRVAARPNSRVTMMWSLATPHEMPTQL